MESQCVGGRQLVVRVRVEAVVVVFDYESDQHTERRRHFHGRWQSDTKCGLDEVSGFS